MSEKFRVRKESPKNDRETKSIERLRAGNFTEQQVQEALLAHSGEKKIGATTFLNHTATDTHVGEYKDILGGLDLHTSERFVNEGRTARRSLEFSLDPEELTPRSDAA